MDDEKVLTALTKLAGLNVPISYVVNAATISSLNLDNLRSVIKDDITFVLTVDEVRLTPGNYLLIKDQIDGAENGIYQLNSSTTSGIDNNASPTTSNTLDKLDENFSSWQGIYVRSGSVNANTTWQSIGNDVDGKKTIQFKRIDATNAYPTAIVEQTVSGIDGKPISLFNSNLGLVGDIFTPGHGTFSALKTANVQLSTDSVFNTDVYIKGTKLSSDKDGSFNVDHPGPIKIFNSSNQLAPSIQLYGKKTSPDATNTTILEIGFNDHNERHYIQSKEPLDIISKTGPSITVDEEGVATFFRNVQCSNDVSIFGNLSLGENLDIGGSLNPSRVNINSIGIDRSSATQDAGQLCITGPDRSLGGPHISTFTANDEYPVINISSWSHNNAFVNFDCFNNSDTATPSSLSGTACQLGKKDDRFFLNYYSPLASTFIPAISLDLHTGSVLFNGESASFSGSNGQNGSVNILPRTDGEESSIAFYRYPTIAKSTSVPDFYKFSHNTADNTFALSHGMDHTILQVQPDGGIHIHNTSEDALKLSGGLNANSLSVAKGARLDGLVKATELFISSKNDVSNDGTAAAIINGGLHVGKSMIVNDQILTGRLQILAKSPRLSFTSSQMNSDLPVQGQTVMGTRILLAPFTAPVSTNTAIGVSGDANQTMWYSVGVAMKEYAHRFFAGSNELLSLTGTGDLTLTSAGGTVSLNGLSSSGVTFNVLETSDPINLNLGDTWTLQKTVDDKLTFIHSGSSSLTVDGTGYITATSLSATNISTSTLVASDSILVDVVKLSSSGILFTDYPILNLTKERASLSFPGSLELNSSAAFGQLGSDTFINRNNSGNVLIYNDSTEILRVSSSGVHISSSLNVDGRLTVSRDISCDLLKCSKVEKLAELEFSGENVGMNFLSTDGKESGSILFDNGLNVTSSSQLNLNVLDAINIFSKNVSVTGTITSLSSISFADGIYGKASSGDNFAATVFLDAGSDDGRWIYVGRLNTSVSSSGIDEKGSLLLSMYGGRDTSQIDNLGEVRFQALVKNGNVTASHHFFGTINTSSDVYVFSNGNNQSLDYHVFIFCKGSSTVDVKQITSGQPMFTEEGTGKLPNGRVSSFDFSWSLVYTTNSKSDSILRIGNVYCDENLVVTGHGVFGENVQSDTVITNKLQATDTLDVYSGDEKSLSCNGSDVQIYKDFLPAVQSVNLGSEDSRFGDVYSNSVSSKSISVETFKVANDFSSMGTVHVAGDVQLDSSLTVSSQLTVRSYLVADEDVQASKDLRVGGDILSSGDVRVDSGTISAAVGVFKEKISATTVNLSNAGITSALASEGNALSFTSDFISISNGQKEDTVKLDHLGNLKSSGHITLSPNEDPLIFASQNGEVVINPIGSQRKSSSFTVNCPATFSDAVSVASLAVLQDVSISGNLSLKGEQLGLGLLQPFISTEDGQVQFNGVQDRDNGSTTARLIFEQSGIVSAPSGLRSFGKSVLNTILSDKIQTNRLEIKSGARFESSQDAQLVVQRLSDSTGNLLLVDQDGTTSAGFFVDDTGLTITTISENATDSMNTSVRLLSSGGMTLNTENSEQNAFTVKGSSSSFSNLVRIESEGLESKGKLVVSYPTDPSDCAVVLKNDAESSNYASISLQGKNADASAPLLSVENTGGPLRLSSAGKRGLSIAESTGNVRIDGMVSILSQLDTDSTSNAVDDSAAFQVAGGALIRGNIVSGKSLGVKNDGGVNISLRASPAMTQSFDLYLPESPPNSAGMCLTSDLDGKLSWSELSEKSSLTSSTSSTSSVTDFVVEKQEHYNAKNGTKGSFVNIPGVKLVGVSSAVSLNIVQVLESPEKGTVTKAALHEIQGIYTGTAGWKWSTKITGDELGITFTVNSQNGQVSYRSEEVDGWRYTTISWSRPAQRKSTYEQGRLLVGQDVSASEEINTGDGVFFSVNGATFTQLDQVPEKSWVGSSFSRPKIRQGKDDVGGDYFASTVSIKGSPIVDGREEDDARTFALNVEGGRVQIADEHDAVTYENAALTVNGGLGIGKNIRVGQNVYVQQGALVLGLGTPMNKITFGKVVVGASSIRSETYTIEYEVPMNTGKYVITGNVVSAVDDNACFCCTFKSLTSTGCKVTVTNVTGDGGWGDIYLAVHYQIVQ
jgi:hypothetical protein